MNRKKEKLYRKENKKSLSTKYYVSRGGEYKWKRSKINRDLDYPMFEPMKSNKKLGVDYTPLYRFLQSKVGEKWDNVYSECIERLSNNTEAIWWVVVKHDLTCVEHNYDPIVRIGESSYCSRLFIDGDGILRSL